MLLHVFIIDFINCFSVRISEKRRLIIPWMVVCIVNILWCIIAVILFLASPVTPPTVLVSLRRSKSREKLKQLKFRDFLKTASFAWEEIGIYLVSIILSLYCILMVWSFLKKIKRSNQVNIIC